MALLAVAFNPLEIDVHREGNADIDFLARHVCNIIEAIKMKALPSKDKKPYFYQLRVRKEASC
jgi:phosphopantetheinyl transferase